MPLRSSVCHGCVSRGEAPSILRSKRFLLRPHGGPCGPMICPNCGHDNLPGSEECSSCLQDLTQLDLPIAQNRVERSLMEDPIAALRPQKPVTIKPTATIRDAIGAMLGKDIGALLVVGDD